MRDRGMIKWQPFNSVVPTKVIIDRIMLEKEKIRMPELSEEQIMNMERFILESFTNQEIMEFYFFRNGKTFKKVNFVKSINNNLKKITFNDNSTLFFKQLINIKKI